MLLPLLFLPSTQWVKLNSEPHSELYNETHYEPYNEPYYEPYNKLHYKPYYALVFTRSIASVFIIFCVSKYGSLFLVKTLVHNGISYGVQMGLIIRFKMGFSMEFTPLHSPECNGALL